MSAFTIDPGPALVALERAYARLDQLGFVEALWQKRREVWSNDSAVQGKVATRLGWLTALDFIAPQLPRLRQCADAIRREGFTHVVLFGMGGSSLAPEVLRQVLSSPSHTPSFLVLDSVDPDAVSEALAHAATSLFIIASKSGTTIEPNSMAAEARRRVVAAGHAAWGTRFMAITDEGTALHRSAVDDGFREVFVNPSDIGGRYSALSLFGMVPAAILGIDLEGLLAPVRWMERACRSTDVRQNPGVALGALMAAGAEMGRDKLTVLLPPRLQSLGLWIEQLVAESTGKSGKGIVPIAGESSAMKLGDDRVVVSVTVGGETPETDVIERARTSRAPVITIALDDAMELGAEFLRWEVATATSGLLLGINPFDEPNVQQAKDATRALLEIYQRQKRLPLPEPHAEISGTRLTLSEAAQAALSGAAAVSFLRVIRRHDYVGLQAFLHPADTAHDAVLQELRMRIAARGDCATMFGYGPRYLHSTGQLHKGGANNGVFLIVTSPPAEDLPIPNEPFSFGVLEMAQAVGDFQSLDRTGRRAMFVHLPRRDAELLRHVFEVLLES